jgi:hypothetical protein
MVTTAMQMTTSKLLLLRAFTLTFGRVPFFSRVLKRLLVHALIRRPAGDPYVASSRFFRLDELD